MIKSFFLRIAFWVFRFYLKARGDQREADKRWDKKNAEDIRNRVDRDLDDRVREYDGTGYRD